MPFPRVRNETKMPSTAPSWLACNESQVCSRQVPAAASASLNDLNEGSHPSTCGSPRFFHSFTWKMKLSRLPILLLLKFLQSLESLSGHTWRDSWKQPDDTDIVITTHLCHSTERWDVLVTSIGTQLGLGNYIHIPGKLLCILCSRDICYG